MYSSSIKTISTPSSVESDFSESKSFLSNSIKSVPTKTKYPTNINQETQSPIIIKTYITKSKYPKKRSSKTSKTSKTSKKAPKIISSDKIRKTRTYHTNKNNETVCFCINHPELIKICNTDAYNNSKTIKRICKQFKNKRRKKNPRTY